MRFSAFAPILRRLFLLFLSLTTSVSAAVVNANLTSEKIAPISASGYSANGNSLDLSLGFSPPMGVTLPVVNNTARTFIQGTFTNLAQGQQVTLTHGGSSYTYVADYYGGTGNDLVLRWANTRLLAWGYGEGAAFGNGGTINSSVPVAVNHTGALAGKSLVAVSAGFSHCLALAADGTLFAWGSGGLGVLGDGTENTSPLPKVTSHFGALSGKRVVAISAGSNHNLALLSDGTAAAWGYNDWGQVGSSGSMRTTLPVAIPATGVLAGKSLVAVSAGEDYSLVLCSDGTMAAWGKNWYGQLGNGTTTNSSTPVLVLQTGALAGKQVIAISAASYTSYALCSDGTVVGWGYNSEGQLGNGSTSSTLVPQLVSMSGVLAGKRIASLGTGQAHTLALADDDTLVSWGHNGSGQLGTGNTTGRNIPTLVSRTGVLSGKTVVATSGGTAHSLALCSDGTLAAWGSNNIGQLGNNTTTNSSLPVQVNTSALAPGEIIRGITTGKGSRLNFAQVASPPQPVATTLPATDLADASATLQATVDAAGGTTSVLFEYGTSTAYGQSIAAAPAIVSGPEITPVSAALSGLIPGTTYHFRVVATIGGGVITGANRTFTTSTTATLNQLSLSSGTLSPAFNSRTTAYACVVPHSVSSIQLTPLAASQNATLTLNGQATPSGAASAPVPLAAGNQTIEIEVSAPGGTNRLRYTILVTRMPATFTFSSAEGPPLRVGEINLSGLTTEFILGFAPTPGTRLRVIENTGPQFIQGTFTHLPHGARVDLVHNGISYPFVADYHGGDGNDLELLWANNRLLAWGDNNNGKLGNNSTINNTPQAVNVDMSGVLAGKTIMGVAAGWQHSLAYTSDGTLAAWGNNQSGQLGNGGTTSSRFPIAVDRSGALAGKQVISAITESTYTIVLCSDGTMASWGSSERGALGSGRSTSYSPVAVTRHTGVLAGRTVVAIAGGANGALALCSDGTLAAWGYSPLLGNNSTSNSNVPVAVDMTGVLAGKRVSRIAVGDAHCVVLCTDGTLAAWGTNELGALGTQETTFTRVPVLVNRSGVLAGKTATALATRYYHNHALCADGSLAAWGINNTGQMGNGTTTNAPLPVLTQASGVLAGRTISKIRAGYGFALALCSDGAIAAWGENTSGQLGNSPLTNSNVPILVQQGGFPQGARTVDVAAGGWHCLATVDLPLLPAATTLAATAVRDTSATLTGEANPKGGEAGVFFEYGLTNAYGHTVPAQPAEVSGTTNITLSAPLSGLRSGTTYHYRLVATGAGGTTLGENRTFTTTTLANLASLSVEEASLMPIFSGPETHYSITLPAATHSTRVTAAVAVPPASVTVNGLPVPSGTASAEIPLTPGPNTIELLVTAEDGVNTMRYSITAIRLPEVFAFQTASHVPVSAAGIAAVGRAEFSLNFPPGPGTSLLLLENTGPNPIQGTFENLPQGQRVEIPHGNAHYAFVADYHGGTGNDLVLRWANNRPLAWGNGVRAPAAVDRSGVLAGKSILKLEAGDNFMMALCADGTLATWGSNGSGELGNNSTADSTVPVLVDTSGVLAGRQVVEIAAGSNHALALCSDGTLVSWGRNFDGQLGNGTFTFSRVPVRVNQNGLLAGKTVISIAAGGSFNLALCSDGTLASWGSNQYGQLGIGSTTNRNVPVAVDLTGILREQQVVAITAGSSHAIALCADGKVATWGSNSNGQLGIGIWADRWTPAWMDTSDALANTSVLHAAGGGFHTLLLTANGTLAACGSGDRGQLGRNNTLSTATPAAVFQTGVLAGKSIRSLRAGSFHSLALATDGSISAWGHNTSGQLGDLSITQRNVPVAVSTSALHAGEIAVSIHAGTSSSLALVASPLQNASTSPATAITGTSATLHGSVHANGNPNVGISFEYGPDTRYGFSAPAGTTSGSSNTPASTTLNNLTPGTTYHFRIVTRGIGGTFYGENHSFTTLSDNARLASLELQNAGLAPEFASLKTSYLATVPFDTTSITVTPVLDHPAARVTVNGTPLPSATSSAPIPLEVGNNSITLNTTAEDQETSLRYSIIVTRLPAEFAFRQPSEIPLRSMGFTTAGNPVTIRLLHAPRPGTVLTMVENTGPGFIVGTFAGLPQGRRITLEYEGQSYPFAVNYYGGSGNDLVLQWADNSLMAWGANREGQLGLTGETIEARPTPLDRSPALDGKTITAIAAGHLHSVALTVEGSIATWGYNAQGQLGTGGTAQHATPVDITGSGALAGKNVIAIAAGTFHSLALCDDGTLAAWGLNNHGQLGDGSRVTRHSPVIVPPSGALAGRTVTAIAAGAYHSLALCEDGTIAAWGYNDEGELGDGTTTTSLIPIAVKTTGALAGRTVTTLAAGQYHTLALCADGGVVSWGYNHRGQLGDTTTTHSHEPVDLRPYGALAGKTVERIAAGAFHSLALCTDGAVAAWGDNAAHQLATTQATGSEVPQDIPTLAGATRIHAGGRHSLATYPDGSLRAWGENSAGQLGVGHTQVQAGVVAVEWPAEPWIHLGTGMAASHNLAVVAKSNQESTTRPLIAASAIPAQEDARQALLNHAFGLDPNTTGQAGFPQPHIENGRMVLRFTQPPAASGISYSAEWSDSLQDGSWQPLTNSAIAPHHLYEVPQQAARAFIRLKVTPESLPPSEKEPQTN